MQKQKDSEEGRVWKKSKSIEYYNILWNIIYKDMVIGRGIDNNRNNRSRKGPKWKMELLCNVYISSYL